MPNDIAKDLNLKGSFPDPVAYEHCHLSVSLSRKEIALALLDADKNTYIQLDSYIRKGIEDPEPSAPGPVREHLEYALKGSGLENKTCKKTRILIENPFVTFVPSKYYDQGGNEAMLKTLYPYLNSGATHFNATLLPSIDAYCVFAYSEKVEKAVNSLLMNARIFHQGHPLVLAFLTGNEQSNEKKIFLNFRHRACDVMITRTGKLILFNTIPFENSNDMVYHLLALMKRSDMDPKDSPVILSGNIDHGDDAYSGLSDFIPSLTFSERVTAFKYDTVFEDIPQHRYMDLLSLPLCE
ncbi:MAG: DUF3822 family protein [Bacteroidales bacterium]